MAETVHPEDAYSMAAGAEAVAVAGAPTILVIEEDALNRALLKDILTVKGYRMLFATKGLEALERLEETRPDLIILDLVVPGISGLELIGMIRRDPNLRNVPIIAATGLPERLYRNQAFELGCDAFIAKPISVTELWTTVDGLLNGGGPGTENGPRARLAS